MYHPLPPLELGDYGLSNNVLYALYRNGICDIDTLNSYHLEELASLPFIGELSIKELRTNKKINLTIPDYSDPNLPIILMDIPQRTRNVLLRQGYRTVKDILNVPQYDLILIRYLGDKGYSHICSYIQRNNLKERSL